MNQATGESLVETAPHSSLEAVALASYYDDGGLMWRNVLWITVGHFGMAITNTILVPLMNLRLKAVGMSDSGVGLLTSTNLWAVSFLVMYFSWKSDHCTSRLGRRTPFVLVSLPFVFTALALFPLFNAKWLLVVLMIFYYFFNDVNASTYPLLSIDCVSKKVLARVSGVVAIVISIAGFLSARVGSRMADVSQARVFLLAATVMALLLLLALWQIKEPPIRHPAEGSFNFLAPIKVACRDRRVVVLMVAIALLNAFPMMVNTWIWFYARSRLGLTIGETGAAMSWGLLLRIAASYPAGWLIDRIGSYVALCIQWVLILSLVVCSIRVTSSNGLILLMVLFALITPLQVAGDTILWKQMDKAETGSFTSTVALIRNFCTGTVIAVSGFLIKWTGSYVAAFWLGFILSTVALLVFFAYRHIMRRPGAAPLVDASGPVKTGMAAESAIE